MKSLRIKSIYDQIPVNSIKELQDKKLAFGHDDRKIEYMMRLDLIELDTFNEDNEIQRGVLWYRKMSSDIDEKQKNHYVESRAPTL